MKNMDPKRIDINGSIKEELQDLAFEFWSLSESQRRDEGEAFSSEALPVNSGL